MRGDLRAPDASGSNSIGRQRLKLQTLKVRPLESVTKVKGRIYTSYAPWAWKDAQSLRRELCTVRESGELSKDWLASD